MSSQRFKQAIAWLLIVSFLPLASLSLPESVHAAHDTFGPIKNDQQPPDESGDQNKPPEKDNPLRWLGDMARRINIFAYHGRLLKDVVDIDLVVGEPDTLRPDTEAAIRSIPDRLRLNFFNYVSTHASRVFAQTDPTPANMVIPNQLNAIDQQTMSFIIPEEMTNELKSTLQNSVLRALNDEQQIDLAIYLLWHYAPFFPRDKAGWNKFKNVIFQADIYLALLILTALLFFDQGNIGLSGYLIEGPFGSRIGWYTSVKRMGFGLSPEITGGLKVRAKYWEVKAGAQKKFDDTDQTRFEAEIATQIFAELAKKIGWETRGSVRVEFITNHSDPNMQNNGTLTGNVYARKGGGLFDGSPYSMSILAGAGIDWNGKPVANSAIIFENERTGFLISINGNYGQHNYGVGNPLSSEYSAAGGAMAVWKFGGGIKLLRSQLDHQISTVEHDIEEVNRLADKLRKLEEEPGIDPLDPRIKKAQTWLGLGRLSLLHHIREYKSLNHKYKKARTPTDAPYRELDPDLVHYAELEARRPTYGAEFNALNVMNFKPALKNR